MLFEDREDFLNKINLRVKKIENYLLETSQQAFDRECLKIYNLICWIKVT